MNPKQKIFWFVAGIVLAVFYFLPTFVNSYRRAVYIQQIEAARIAKAQAAAQKPSPLPASSPAPGTEAPTAASAPATFDNLLGVWQGMAPLPGRGMCSLKLELRRSLEPGQYSGFPV